MATINNLPNEALFKIFSYLNLKDLMRVELVSWNFYNATKNPLLWKKVEVKIDNRKKLHSFCDFFTKHHFPLKMKIDFKEEFKIMAEDVYHLNRLFSRLNNLWCLHVKELDISDIILPPTVRYFNYFYKSEAICDPARQYTSVLNCAKIESLIMIFIWSGADLFNQETLPKVAEAGKSILKKYKSSLKILHLRPLHCQWVPHITRCLNLKELTVLFGYFEYARNEPIKFKGLANLPRLESLVVDYAFFDQISPFLKEDGLPDLKHLSIMDSLPSSKDDFIVIQKQIPNIVTLCISGTVDVKNLFQLIKNCKSIKYLCFGGECVCSKDRIYFMNKIYNLSQVRKFESICFCELIYSYTLIDKVDYVKWFKERFSDQLFSCKKCYSVTRVSHQCTCWPEKRFNYADRFFALHSTSNLAKFPLPAEIESSDTSDNERV